MTPFKQLRSFRILVLSTTQPKSLTLREDKEYYYNILDWQAVNIFLQSLRSLRNPPRINNTQNLSVFLDYRRFKKRTFFHLP
jgi:hypothetical protein